SDLPEKQSVWFNGPYNSGIIVTKENYGTLEVKFDEKILHIPINSSDGYFLKGLSQDVKENPEILKKPEACIIINDPRNIFPWPNVTDCVLFFSAAQLYGKDDFKLMVVDPTQPKEIDLSTSPLTLAQNDDNTSSNLLISSEKLDLGPLKPIYLKRVEEALNSGSSYIVDNRVIGIIDLSSIPKDSVVYFSNEQFSQIREIGDKILRDELKIATMYNISNKGKLNKVLLSNIGDGVVPDEILKECSYYLIFKGVSFESSDNKLEIKGLNGFKEVLVGIKNVQGMSKYLTKMRNEEGECYYPSN
ncbi:MAG: hypothetical protein KQA41_00385, partial [Candidatus Aenigmarchaeota archaeon]|nr:hypothetical protein [Candidatus Aenigmarchaeota archaeon]